MASLKKNVILSQNKALLLKASTSRNSLRTFHIFKLFWSEKKKKKKKTKKEEQNKIEKG